MQYHPGYVYYDRRYFQPINNYYHYPYDIRYGVPYNSYYRQYRVPTEEQTNAIVNCVNEGNYRHDCYEQFGLNESDQSYMNQIIDRLLGPEAGIPEGGSAASGSSLTYLPDLPPSATIGGPEGVGHAGEEIIYANGKKMRCHWVYCCEPIEQAPVMPTCTEPGSNEDKIELSSPPIEGIPEFQVGECGNEFGFCLNTRTSTLRLIARVVFPKDAAGAVRDEINQCFEVALEQALLAASPYFGTMAAQPETVPALLPQAVEAALQRGTLAFKECMLTKATVSYLFNSGLIKFCVFHTQEATGDWQLLTSRDVIRIMDKLLFMSTVGLAGAFFPGVGSFEQVAQKLGIDTEELSQKITAGFESLGEEGQRFIDKLKVASKNPVKSVIGGVGNLATKAGNAVEDFVSDPVKSLGF